MAKDIMSRADKSSVSSGFANRPGSWDNTVGPAIDAVGGALGDVAMGGIGLIVDHIAQPLADMLLGMFDSGQKPSPDTIKQAVADLFSKDTELQKKLGAYQPEDMPTEPSSILGGGGIAKPVGRR